MHIPGKEIGPGQWAAQRPQRLPAASTLPWHAHDEGYAAIVLSGAYVEAGDGGRVHAEAGRVLVHPPFSGHADWIEGRAVEIVNIPLPLLDALRLTSGVVANPEGLLGDLRRGGDPAALLQAAMQPAPAAEDDLADRLARALAGPDPLPLADWAECHGISARTLTRHFRQAFGIAPARHRWRARTLAAWREIMLGGTSLAEIAASAGFADQAHMTRAVAALTGRSPGLWRRSLSVSFKTDAVAAG